MTAPTTWSRSVAEVDLAAIAHNVKVLRQHVGAAAYCAVVKADGYGHGAVPVARAALAAGAHSLAVAHPTEGAALRAAGIDAPILLLSEPFEAELATVLAARLEVAVYSPAAVARLAAAGQAIKVHLKVDTGMRRVGADPADVVDLARAISAAPSLHLAGLWTHCAVADEVGNRFTDLQLTRFEEASAALRSAGIAVAVRHAANSAAALGHPASRYDLVRVGLATYGISPFGAAGGASAAFPGLRPALRWTSEVAYLKRVRAGEGVSYGLHHTLDADSVVATVPVGYADGLPRRWGLTGGRVLIGGRCRPIVGVVTMDQILVDCGAADGPADGPAVNVAVGDEVVLLGQQGDAAISAGEIAEAVDTIPYEILTSIGPRVARRYRGAQLR